MPRDVNGTYALPTNDSSPAAPRNVIRSSDFNELTGDYATALTDSLSRSGKGKMQADLDMDGNDVLNAANLVERGDSADVIVFPARMFDTIAAAEASRMLVIPNTVVTNGHTVYGTGGATYKRVASEPAHAGKLLITPAVGATVWFEISDSVLWIEQFGALGSSDTADGAANRTAIEAAIACVDVRGSGGQISAGPGLFWLDNTVSIDTENTIIRFKGTSYYGTRFAVVTNTPKVVFDIGTANYESGTLVFEDFAVITPSNPAARIAGNVAFKLLNRGGVVFNRVRVDDNWDAIQFTGSFGPIVNQCWFNNCPGGGLNFAADKSANGARITSNQFFSNALTSLGAAIAIPDGEGIYIAGNDIEGNYGGILLTSPQSVEIVGNYIERNTGFNIFIGSGTAKGIEINGCWLGESPAWTVGNVDGISITGCTFFDTSISFASTATDYTFERNHHSGTGSIPGTTEEQFSVLTADISKANVNTAQNWFASGEDEFTVDANCAYFIEGDLFLYRNAGTTAHTTTIKFGGTATVAVGSSFIADASNDNDGVLGAVRRLYSNLITTGIAVTPSNSSATEVVLVHLRGHIMVTSAGTIIPQFQYSAAPGGAPFVLSGSKMQIKKMGHKDVKKLGWS